MTRTISDLTEELVVEILSRVSVTSLGSVRSTCKKWNALSRNHILCKVAEAKNQFMGFMVKNFRFCSLRIDLQGDDFIDVSIKQVSVLNQIGFAKTFHCDGLLLCFPHDRSRLLVWNPYLGQTRWIRHKFRCHSSFFLGYDTNRNHKILEISYFTPKTLRIYEFSSNSWRYLDVTWEMPSLEHGGNKTNIVMEGNAYLYAQTRGRVTKHFLCCFDFTSERFGPHLSLPFDHSEGDIVALSSVREEKLAVLRQRRRPSEIIEIWVTNKIDNSELSWTKFLEVDLKLHTGFPIDFNERCGNFFIDEEKKVAVIFDLRHLTNNQLFNEEGFHQTAHNIGQDGYFNVIGFHQIAHIIGQDGYIKSRNFGAEDVHHFTKANFLRFFMYPFVCSSYVPSLVQIE